jgi:Domain of unknown function (DUF4386)
VLFSILKRESETLSLGYVTARLVECTFIAIGLVSVLAVVSLGQDPATGASVGQDAAGGGAGAAAAGVALAAIKDWTFVLGPGFIVGIGNGLILGYLMYRSGLVPRRMAVLGLVGGPLVCLSGIAVLFGVFDPGRRGSGDCDDSGVPVGAVARPLSHVHRIQAVANPPRAGCRASLTQSPGRDQNDEAPRRARGFG